EALTALAKRPRRPQDPPVELLRRARPLREVLQRQCRRAQRVACRRTLRGAAEPATRRGVYRQLAELPRDHALGEFDDLRLGQHAREPANQVAQWITDAGDV